MTDYQRYAAENEDLEAEDNGTDCESCGVGLGEQDLVICQKCEAREDAQRNAFFGASDLTPTPQLR